ncbi:ABC transporter permease subunit [Isoptericola sp. b441]|uniref:ABC transporter permease subunit n=1 Tax=Actinotalea lenta TaxID=3064654 RepID=A0ABT9D8G6_9CELL|nr:MULTISPECIES: ABC transporter permease subunit [unclassified Isoptericola]MDO8106840.1 ABC transporter permease subunit [Isoptericola sp. b441]MDO8121449.1 ABC transporter permease subunit [Isoptericola sp. b490]
MTATTLSIPARTTRPAGRVTFPRAVLAEWIKFRTVRSTVWTLVATVVVMVGISVLAAWGTTTNAVDAGSGSMNIAQLLSAGYQLAQLAVAVLGVLTVTGEYSTGMIRSTLAAVPRRTPVLAAKALVLAVVVLVVSVVSMGLSYLATMPWHDQLHATFDLTDPVTVRMTVGLPLYLMAISLFAFAVGALLRHSAGALTAVIALLLVVENVLMLIPLRFVELMSPFLPSTAGRRVLFDAETLSATDAMTNGAHLTPWEGYGVLLAWVLVLVTTAGWLLRRRDA